MPFMRCITLNLKGLTAGWHETRKQVVLDGLIRLKPDILFLQETAVKAETQLYHQPEVIGAACGLKYCAFAPHGHLLEVMSAYQEGLAIVSRWPFLSVRTRRLPPGIETPPDSRVVLYTKIESPVGPIHAVNLHLPWRDEELSMRLVHMGLVMDELFRSQALAPGSRTLIAGDLNGIENEPAVRLARKRLQDTFRTYRPDEPGYTWTQQNPLTYGWNHMPDRRLDYLFCSRDAKVHHSEVVFDDRDEPAASDHFGVLSDIEWPLPGQNRSASVA